MFCILAVVVVYFEVNSQKALFVSTKCAELLPVSWFHTGT